VGITPVFVGEDNAHIETRFILSNTLRVNVVDGSPLLDPIFTHVKVTFVGTHPAIVRSARLRVVGSLRPDAHARLYVLAEHVEALHA
jgi:hypothetical protein